MSVRTSAGAGSLAGESQGAVVIDAVADAVLVHRARGGDDAAFQALYERHHTSVTRVCRRWLADEQLVEDAVQETFVKAWGALATFTGGERFGRWVRRIAKNHCHSMHRAWVSRGREVVSEVVIDLPGPDAAGSVDSLAVHRMLAGLAPRDAALLVQRHVVELSVPTMATRWGLSQGSMDVALHRARVRARRLASAEGLRGLLPAPLLRRLGGWLQRLSTSRADIAVAAAEAVAPLVIAAGLTLPGLAVAQAESALPLLPSVAAAERVQVVSTAARSDRVARVAPQGVAEPEPGPGAHNDAGPDPAVPQPRRQAWRHAPVPFEPVPVPGTGGEIRQTPSDRHRPSYSVGVDLAGRPEYESSEQNPEDAAIAAACPTIDAAPGTFCEQH